MSYEASGLRAQPQPALTPRQEEIRLMLRQGMSNKMIAGALGISEGTVKNHITEILRVLNANNRTQAAQQDTPSLYDIEEYLHLAMHASSRGDIHACMNYLKELLQLQPGHALALYLLATQHAEIGMYERAIKGMRAALALNPGLETARFQLGLLLLDRNRTADAKEQFAALLSVSEPILRSYSEGMVAVLDNDLVRGAEKLNAALAAKATSPGLEALNEIMRGVLARVSAMATERSGRAAAPADELFLGAYREAPPRR
jgi:DNA-binding CsgD family transcriptional regulator